jgi:hypothetical protein
MADYYREHHLAYHLRTFHLDPSSFLGPLTDALPGGGRVFYLWEPEGLQDLLDQLGLVTMVRFSQPSITGADDTWLTFLLKRSVAT